MLSIVVPTLNESENLDQLIRAIHATLDAKHINYEIVLVDDSSSDGTAGAARQLGKNFPVKVIERKGLDRDLSMSVLDGFREASFDNIIVMDADLSHPAESLPIMLDILNSSPDAMVVGSRYAEGGSFDRDWHFWRYLNSRLATVMAKPLTSCSDPMSGFFGLNRRMLKGEEFKPLGYKIALELMVRCNFSSVIETPIDFRDREAGQSKMDLQQQLKYLLQLRRLYLLKFGAMAEFLHFLFVGLGGFVIDVSCYYLLQLFSVPHLQARALSFWPAVTANWLLNRTTTFGQRKRRPRMRQWLEFLVSCSIGFSLSWGIYFTLTSSFSFFDHYRFLALISGMAVASVFNFTAATLFVYSEKRL